MNITTTGFPDGTDVLIQVFRMYSSVVLYETTAKVTGGQVSESWRYDPPPFRPSGGSFRFEARIRSKCAWSRSLDVTPHSLRLVLGIQERLRELGYYGGTFSGSLDTETIRAVKQFQERHQPLVVDGDPGPFTIALMQRDSHG